MSWDLLWVSSSLYSLAFGKPIDLPRSRLWIRFSSSHFWSLLHWRHLSRVLPTSVVACCLSSLRAGVCSHLWERRVPAWVLLVAWLPLPRVWRSAPSFIPLMFVHRPVLRSILAYLRLSFEEVFSGLVQVFSCLALSVPVGVRSDFAPAVFSSLWFV